MQPVLTLAQSASALIGVDPPSSLLTASGFGPVFRAHLNHAGKELSQMAGPHREGWHVLTKVLALTTVAGQEDYTLPHDFRSLNQQTVWSGTQHWPARGPLSPGEWQYLRRSLVGSVTWAPYYRVRSLDTRRKVISFDPIPGQEETIYLEYLSSYWLRDTADGALTKDRITADTDVPAFDDDLLELDLVWRFKQSRGQDFLIDLSKFEHRRDSTFYHDQTPQSVTLGGREYLRPGLGGVSMPGNWELD